MELANWGEHDRAILLAFYEQQENSVDQFSIDDLSRWLTAQSFPAPNKTRLRDKLRDSKYIVYFPNSGHYRIHHAKQAELEANWLDVFENDEIQHDGTVIPRSVYVPSRSFVESLADQINASYTNNIFDGCAVLMRRLLEILLISAMEKVGDGASIKGADGNYMMLEVIVDRAKASKALALSRNSKETVETFRKLGNFSAHKIHYLCKRDDLKRVALDYRALIQELLFKADFIK